VNRIQIGIAIVVASLLVAAATPRSAGMATPELFDSGVPRGSSEILAGYYTDAAKRIKQVVENPSGRTAGSKEFKRARAATLIDQVDQVLGQLGHATSGWIGKNVPAAAVAGRKLANKQAVEAGVRPKGQAAIEGSFHLIDHRAVQVLAIDAFRDLNKAAQGMGDRAKFALHTTAQQELGEAEINKILAGGLIEGKPVETIKKLRDALKQVHGETVKVINKNGDEMNFDAGYYAELVARTKTRQASVVARHERLSELGMDLVAIVGLISKNFCTAFLGQVFSLSGNSDKYPAYSSLPGGGPPFHPLCSKSTRPFVEELASDKQLDQADGLDDADKLLGMDATQAQRAFKDLQIHAQQKDRYATTASKLFG
jgi:hypothetical protein